MGTIHIKILRLKLEAISVGVEPTLQPLTGEQFSYRSANVEDGAQLDVVAEGFWDRRQKAYFDVKVFVLLHFLSVIDGRSLRKDKCMKNVFGR